MELAAFKTANGISKIGFYQSKSSSRKVGSAMLSNGTEATFITTEDFNVGQPAYVHAMDAVDEETGVTSLIHWVSNKAPREADFSL